MKHLPNIITCFRIALVPVFALWMLDQEFAKAFLLMLLLGISDALDGFLAKTFNYRSKLGAWLDPMADKVALISAFLLTYHFGFLPLWFLLLIVLRDAAVMGGLTMIRYRYNEREFLPHWTGKLSTFLQFVLILIILAGEAPQLPAVSDRAIMGFIVLTAIASLSSFAIYMNEGLAFRSSEAKNGRQYNS